jgi:hypothetical protein
MKILDCFPYWREYSHVTARRDLWSQYPEHDVTMVAMVGTHTHSGEPISYTDPIRDGLEPGIQTHYADIGDPTLGSWDRERKQRDLLRQKILELGSPGDLVISSDADEIVNPLCINDIYKATYNNQYVTLEMVLLYYSLYTASPIPWLHAKAFMWENTPGSLSEVRVNLSCYVQPTCGWHISWQGGADSRREKAKAFAHTEFSNEEAILGIEDLVATGRDFLGVTLVPYPQDMLPSSIKEKMK